MPRSSAPRRAARRRTANTPMMRETHRRLALELRLAVESLVGAPSPESYNVLSKMLAALRRAGINAEMLEPATSTMNHICDRFELMGEVDLSGNEATTLRQQAGALEQLLPRLPVNVFARAVAEVEALCAIVESQVPQNRI